ncbi:ABC transporter permease subunit [Variovorax sp. YR752]|uniref:ABC transporter permease n=1 Tax=Variovorax sp. YR752 TaxID=1884383 RepID=UPI003137E8C2
MADAGALFPDWRTPLRDATNALIESLVVDHGDQFERLSNGLLGVLVAIEQGLRSTPPWVVLAVTAALGLAASRRWAFALLAAAGLWLVGALGQWDQAMQTLALVLVSVLVSLVLGLPLGVLCARSSGLRRLVMPMLDLMQTIPSFVYLIPAAMLFGLGKVPAILATVIYAAPPLIRLTDLGIRQVSAEAVEAARAFGATRGQLLVKVQIPLSLPTILQGINQTTMMALAMVVIASMIGARGVGETVLVGLQRNDPGTGLIGGLVIVILAIVLDRLMQAGGARWQGRRPGAPH